MILNSTESLFIGLSIPTKNKLHDHHVQVLWQVFLKLSLGFS